MARKEQVTVKQHYVPACYLARFTLEGKRSSGFYVHPVDGSPVRESTPNAEACENHYHTIDVPGFDPDYFEGLFEKYEAPACSLFKTLSENPGKQLDSDKDLETVAMFFSVQAARLPQAKEKFEKWVRKDAVEFMDKIAHSAEFRQRVEAKTGIRIGRGEHEGLKKAVESGAIKFDVDKNHVIFGMLNLVEAFLDTIDGMFWTLLYCHGPEWFVCSDLQQEFSTSSLEVFTTARKRAGLLRLSWRQTYAISISLLLATLRWSYIQRTTEIVPCGPTGASLGWSTASLS
jgi:hypothetical protein